MPSISCFSFFLLFTRMWLHVWDSLRHTDTHIIHVTLHLVTQTSFILAEEYTLITCMLIRLQHLCLLRRYTDTLAKLFLLKGCQAHASTTEAQLIYLTVILLHWRGLSCPQSSLAVKGLAFSLHHSKPIRALL